MFRSMVILAMFFSLNSFANDLGSYNGTYSVQEYVWCNGPHSGKTPGSCSFWGWNGVDVDSISMVQIKFEGENDILGLTDIKGSHWEIDLMECVSPSHLPAGCSHQIERKDQKLMITIQQWQSGRQSRLAIEINENEISIFGPDHAHIVFEVAKDE